MEFRGVPLHPLVVHAALAIVVLAAISALTQAVWVGSRWFTRWTTPALAVGALVVVVLTRASGQALLEDRFAGARGGIADLLQTHQDRADVLLWTVVALAVVAVAAWAVLPVSSPLRSGRGARSGVSAAWVRWTLPAALVVTAVLSLVWLVLTGDAGARAVWEQ